MFSLWYNTNVIIIIIIIIIITLCNKQVNKPNLMFDIISTGPEDPYVGWYA
jgi:hypothetical protein